MGMFCCPVHRPDLEAVKCISSSELIQNLKKKKKSIDWINNVRVVKRINVLLKEYYFMLEFKGADEF